MVLLKIAFDLDPDLYGDGKQIDAAAIAESFPREQAEEMAKLPGLIWKLWASQPEENKATGFYLFATRDDAEHRLVWAQKHFPKVPGLTNVQGEYFDIMDDLTRVTRGPIDLPANPSIK